MANDTMLYKCPGPHAIHGGMYDYIIVDQDNKTAFAAALEGGWSKTTTEASAEYNEAQDAMFNGKTPATPAAKPVPAKPAPKPVPTKGW